MQRPDNFKNIFKFKDEKAVVKTIKQLQELYPNIDVIDEKFCVLTDIIQALTNENYGFGHEKGYYRGDIIAQCQELFANSHQCYWEKNELLNIFLPNSARLLNDYYTNMFKEWKN